MNFTISVVIISIIISVLILNVIKDRFVLQGNVGQ